MCAEKFVDYFFAAIAVYSAISFRDVIGAPSLRIATNPRQGPFRLGQTVEFTCEVDPVPEVLVYQWRAVDGKYGSSTYSGRSFNKTFYDDTLRFCWYFCSVTHNQTLLGKADKLVEVHGEHFLYFVGNMLLLKGVFGDFLASMQKFVLLWLI